MKRAVSLTGFFRDRDRDKVNLEFASPILGEFGIQRAVVSLSLEVIVHEGVPLVELALLWVEEIGHVVGDG